MFGSCKAVLIYNLVYILCSGGSGSCCVNYVTQVPLCSDCVSQNRLSQTQTDQSLFPYVPGSGFNIAAKPLLPNWRLVSSEVWACAIPTLSPFGFDAHFAVTEPLPAFSVGMCMESQRMKEEEKEDTIPPSSDSCLQIRGGTVCGMDGSNIGGNINGKTSRTFCFLTTSS